MNNRLLTGASFTFILTCNTAIWTGMLLAYHITSMHDVVIAMPLDADAATFLAVYSVLQALTWILAAYGMVAEVKGTVLLRMADLGFARPRVDGYVVAGWLLALLGILPVGALGMYLSHFWQMWLHLPASPSHDPIIAPFTGYPLSQAVMIVQATVLAPIAEEMLFRGAIQTQLSKIMPTWLAIPLTALAFALMHLDISNLWGYVGVGLVLGLVAHHARSILPSIALHALVNTTFVLMHLLVK